MPRQLRHDVEGGWYHITTRGMFRKDIFENDRDREHFVELLALMVERYCVVLHAYVLMDNHYHLLIETPEANASRALQWLNLSYAAWFNAKHQRSGPVFQARFKSIPVDGEGSWALPSYKGQIMKLRLISMLVCITAGSLTAVGESEQMDFGYWRLKSGTYEYSVKQTVFSNAMTKGGWSYSVAFRVTILNMTNKINVVFKNLISDVAIGTTPEFKAKLEAQSRQIQRFKGTLTIINKDNKLELEKSCDLLADDFLGQFKHLLSFPIPAKLVDGMIWTNPATFYPGLNTEVLMGHNESNEQYVISKTSVKVSDAVNSVIPPSPSIDEPCIVVDRRADQIILLSKTFTRDKVQKNIQTLKFIEDIKKE